MRRLVVVLMLAVSFALGMFSQNLIAGNWVVPPYGTSAPSLTVGSRIVLNGGRVLYTPPSGWKVVDTCPSSSGAVLVSFQKLE